MYGFEFNDSGIEVMQQRSRTPRHIASLERWVHKNWESMFPSDPDAENDPDEDEE